MEATRSLQFFRVRLCKDCLRNGFWARRLKGHFGQGVLKGILGKAKVNPSQRSPDDAHEAWIIAKPDGCIVSAHCTCKAG